MKIIKHGEGISKGRPGNSHVRKCAKSSEMILRIINLGFWEL